MEVRAIGQGGQNTLDLNRSNSDKFVQMPNNYTAEKYTANDNNTRDKDLKENDVKDAIEKLNKFLEDNGTHAEYEVHDKFKTIMIKIVDNKTKEVIQEVPPKKILDMVAKMMEMVGVLFDKKA